MLLKNILNDNTRPIIKFKNGQYFSRYRNPELGIDRSPKFSTLEQAKEWRKEMISTYGAIQTKGPANNTLSFRQQKESLSLSSPLKYFIEFWLKHIKNIPKPPAKSTIGALKHMLDYDFVLIPVNKLNYLRIKKYLSQRSRSDNNPKASTLNTDVAAIKRVVREATQILGLEYDMDTLDKASKLLTEHGFISQSEKKDRRLEKGDWERLMLGLHATKKTENLRNKYILMFKLYISTALRTSELLSLRWKDIDFDAMRFKVVVLKQYGEVKSIPMLEETKKLFLKLRPENYHPEEPIFHVNASTIGGVFTEVAKHAALKGISLHDLRTEGISRMLEMGLPVHIVALFTGHMDLELINRIYSNMKAENVVENLNLIIEINKDHLDLISPSPQTF